MTLTKKQKIEFVLYLNRLNKELDQDEMVKYFNKFIKQKAQSIADDYVEKRIRAYLKRVSNKEKRLHDIIEKLREEFGG